MTNRLLLRWLSSRCYVSQDGTAYAQVQKSNPARQTWEYIVVDAYNDPDHIFYHMGAQAGSIQEERDYYLSNAPDNLYITLYRFS